MGLSLPPFWCAMNELVIINCKRFTCDQVKWHLQYEQIGHICLMGRVCDLLCHGPGSTDECHPPAFYEKTCFAIIAASWHTVCYFQSLRNKRFWTPSRRHHFRLHCSKAWAAGVVSEISHMKREEEMWYAVPVFCLWFKENAQRSHLAVGATFGGHLYSATEASEPFETAWADLGCCH